MKRGMSKQEETELSAILALFVIALVSGAAIYGLLCAVL